MSAVTYTGTLVGSDGSKLVVRDAELSPATPTTPPPPLPPQEPPSARRSGLAWSSGVFANDRTMPARFEAMRGRKVDLADVHCDASDVGNPYWLRGFTPATVGGLTLSCPLTPGQPPSAFEAAGKAMAAAGFRGPLARLRPGVELNLPNESRVTDATADAWAARFRTAANAFRKGAGAGALVCLCVNEGRSQVPISDGNLNALVLALLRDGSADELGVDFYDQWPPMFSAQEFEQRIAPGRFGSLGYWADVASGNGRKVAVPEWGVGRNDAPGQWAGHAGGDNPVFVGEMVAWFRRNVGRLGYESYFAEPAAYIACDLTTQMPRSRAAYVAALR